MAEVKQKISLKEGIPPSQQQLIFSGMSLADDQLVNSYNIQRDSTIHLVIKVSQDSAAERKVHSAIHSRRDVQDVSSPPDHANSVASSSRRPHSGHQATIPASLPQQNTNLVVNCTTQAGRTFRVNAQSNDLVVNLKQRLATMEGIVLRQQEMVLYLGGRELEDQQSLSHYGLSSNMTVRMQLNTRSVSTLFVKTLNGKTYILYPSENSVVSEIKAELQEKSGILALQQRLVYQGRDLPDQCTLSQCGVPAQCTLHVIQTNPPQEPPSRPLPLLIRTFTGKVIAIDALPGDSVRNFKEKIMEKEGFPADEIVVMFGGKELEDDKVLDHYQIQQGSTLLVTFKPKAKLTLAVVNMQSSEIIKVEEVNNSDSISLIHQKLSALLTIPRHVMSLVSNGQLLNPQLTVEQYDITRDSLLHLYTSHPTVLSIVVTTVAGIKCTVEISSFRPVSALKDKVQALLGIPSDEQVLLHKGNVLDDASFISDFVSLTQSTVHMFCRRGVTRNIVIRTSLGDSIRKHIFTDTTVAQIKKTLEEERGFLPEQVTISYKGRDLEDQYIVGDYAIPEGAVLLLNFLTGDITTITIQPDDGTSPFTVKVSSGDSINVLKLKVANCLMVPVNSLTLSYGGAYLPNNCLIRECNIPSPCVLFVEICTV